MNDNKIMNELFTESMRPKSLQQCIMLERVREELEKGKLGNIMFYGSAGIGKSSICRILREGHDYIEINASLERGIDVIRDQVITFASSVSLMGDDSKLKIIQLEECDQLTPDAWKSLRAVMEKYHKNVRFLANCNYVEKIPEPIQSRFNMIPLEPINAEEEAYLFEAYKQRIGKILDYLKIEYTDENVTTFIKNNFPDMRSLVKKIQQLYNRNAHELTPDMLSASFDCSDLFKMIMSAPDPWNNYKMLISEWSNKAEEAVLQIGENFPEYLHTVNSGLDGKIPQVIIATAEHQHMLVTAIDKFVVLASLVLKLQYIINS